MYILGLNVGHNATACLLKDGKIVGCVSEERFTRVKNECGFPKNSIKWIFQQWKIKLKDLDLVVLTNDLLRFENYKFSETFIKNYKDRKFLEKIKANFGYKYPRFYELCHGLREGKIRKNQKKNAFNIKKSISRVLKISEEKIRCIGHHEAHAYSTCFNLSKNNRTLIFTLDGEGSDGLCATVNIYDGKNLKVISKTKKTSSLGYLYAIITTYLGMKPLEHEFKVMGMAPYAKEDKSDELYEKKFRDLVWIDKNLELKSKFNLIFSDIFIEKELKFQRFDNISAAVQKLIENLAMQWIRAAIKRTGIENIALSGGVFMNVKANQKIAEMPEVKNLFVMPSCGDEANAIGACFYGYKKYCENKGINITPAPIKDLYLGPDFDEGYIQKFIEREKLKKRYKIKKIKDINKKAASLLARGEIIARCSGKSEWGARALGNRSILANPSNTATIKILNETIKDRDFWMPFTPSILDCFEKKYIANPKKIFAPYMCITFDSTRRAQKELPAALHPYDLTIRPQIVTEEFNKEYYKLIELFYNLTGIGAVLNTSFNLHGEPNVLTPEDAVHTVDNSSLKYLIIENYLFEKKDYK